LSPNQTFFTLLVASTEIERWFNFDLVSTIFSMRESCERQLFIVIKFIRLLPCIYAYVLKRLSAKTEN